MIEQETDCEGHQKLMALMTVFKLETDYPSQGLASSLRSWRFCLRARLRVARPQGKRKGKEALTQNRQSRKLC